MVAVTTHVRAPVVVSSPVVMVQPGVEVEYVTAPAEDPPDEVRVKVLP